MPDFTDNGASNFIKYGNDYFATSETNYIRMIDPVTLETKDKVREREREAPLVLTPWQPSAAGSQSSFVLDPQVDYMKFLPVNLACSHPHYDKDGNAYNMGTSIAEKGKTKYMLFKVPAVSANGN